jgi:DNA-binding HxlR family transcriptional regulator
MKTYFIDNDIILEVGREIEAGQYNLDYCPVSDAMKILEGKWKITLIYFMIDGPKRYGELKRMLPDISEKILIHKLRELETEKIVQRKTYSEIPPKVEYSLTEYGQTLRPVLEVLNAWGKKHIKASTKL